MLHQRSLLVTLTLHCPTFRRADKDVTDRVLLDHHAGRNAGNFVKNLLPDEAAKKRTRAPAGSLAAILQHDADWRDWHIAQTSPFLEGARLLDIRNYDTYMAGHRERTGTRQALVDGFLPLYAQKIAQAKAALNGLFNEEDYPPANRLNFTVEFDVLPVPQSGHLVVDLTNAEVEELQAKLNHRLAQATDEARLDDLRKLAEPLSKLVTRSRKFPELWDDMGDVLDVLSRSNVSGDPTLEDLRRLAEQVHRGFTPDELKTSETRRQAAADQAKTILAKMQAYVTA